MALIINDPATEAIVHRLAELTGETVATAIHRAAAERLQRLEGRRDSRGMAADLLEIGARCAALPDLDSSTIDEMLGYDEHGLPR